MRAQSVQRSSASVGGAIVAGKIEDERIAHPVAEGQDVAVDVGAEQIVVFGSYVIVATGTVDLAHIQATIKRDHVQTAQAGAAHAASPRKRRL